MAVSIYNIKKWSKMIFGNSILHVEQGKGKYYSKDKIMGYYNDLTEKITKDNVTKNGELPQYPGNDGIKKIFPIGVFQYGLAAYDLYLESKNKIYLDKFKMCVDWTYKHQDTNGGWKTFEYENPQLPYSAMAQGEAISLLSRAYVFYNDKKYINSLKKGMIFLMTSTKNGGVALYDKKEIYLKEFVDRPVVMNGWIFSIFGIYDYLMLFPTDNDVKSFFSKTIDTLEKSLKCFDIGYWSKYDIDKRIASPFYHKLHIAQLYVLYDLTQKEIYIEYAKKWDNCEKSKIKKIRAFVKKAIQKILEKN